MPLRRRVFTLLAAVAAIAASAGKSAAQGTFSLYGPPADNTIVNAGPPSDPVVVEGVSSGDFGYAGMAWQAPAGFTLGDLELLSSDYQMLDGSTFHAGAPRFTLFDDSFNTAYVYWGTPLGGGSFWDPNGGVWGGTGNYIDPTSTDARWAANGFGGVNTPNTLQTYAQFAADVPASTPISYITLDLNGGSDGEQTMLFDLFTVNSDVYDAVPEPTSLALAGLGLFGAVAFGLSRVRRQK